MACAILGMEAFITFEKESVRIFGVNMVKQISVLLAVVKKLGQKKNSLFGALRGLQVRGAMEMTLTLM